MKVQKLVTQQRRSAIEFVEMARLVRTSGRSQREITEDFGIDLFGTCPIDRLEPGPADR
jgi:hypothetical protein